MGEGENEMSDQLAFDEAQAKAIEELYLSESVLARRKRALELVELGAGDTFLDLGCGPGFLAVEAVEVVGTQGQVHGLDSSDNMLSIARSRAEKSGVASALEFHEGDVLNLPFPDDHFDAAAVLQVYEYIEDIDAALTELCRILKPGARYVIIDTDWDSFCLQSEDSALTNKIMNVFEQHLADPNLPRKLEPKLSLAGLQVHQIEPFVQLAIGKADTFTKAVKKIIVDYVKGKNGLTDAEIDRWLHGLQNLDDSDRTFLSLNQYFFSGRKSP